MNAVETSDINLNSGITLNNIGKIFGGRFQQTTKTGFDFGKFDAQNALEFIKKYNKFNGKSKVTLPKIPKGKVDAQLPKKKGKGKVTYSKVVRSKAVGVVNKIEQGLKDKLIEEHMG